MIVNKLSGIIPFIAVVMLWSCSEKKTEDTNQKEKVKVKVETVTMQAVPQTSEFTATVQANIKNNIAPQNPVRIEKILVEVGDHVTKGQKLVQMDEVNLAQAKTQLDNLEIEFKRTDELYKVGGTSKSDWDAKKTSFEVARTAYKNLVENTQLVSPIDGIVTARNYDSGDMYSGADPVLVVEQIRPVKLYINVSESYFTQVKKGMDVTVKLDVYGDEAFTGKVSLVYPTIDPQTRTFPVEIKIVNANEKVRPGMFARVTIDFGAKERIVVPDRAIVKQSGSGDRYVYVYKDGKVSYVKVELGRRLSNKYELVSGVENGAQVVITGQSRLNNGMEVDIVK